MDKRSDFIEAIERRIENMTDAYLRGALLDISDYIPREKWETVLVALDRYRRAKPAHNPEELLKDTHDLCKCVGEGFYSFELNEEYDDWDNNGDEYIDSDDLGPELEECLKIAIELEKQGAYQQMLSVMDMIFTLRIPCVNADDLSVDTLFHEGFISLNLSEIRIWYARAAIMSLNGEECVQKLWDIIGYRLSEQSLAAIIGDCKIPDKDNFLSAWISFLAGKCGDNDNTNRLDKRIIEAVLMRGGTSALLAYAREGGAGFASAYLTLVKASMEENDYTNAIQTASEALGVIRPINGSRREIADHLVKAGECASDIKARSIGLMEGFASCYDISHFLSIIEFGDKDMESAALKRLEKNGGNDFDTYCIWLLEGEYERVWDIISKDRESLDWSRTVKGRILPVYAVLLSRSKTLGKCVSELVADQFGEMDGRRFTDIFLTRKKTLTEIDNQKYYNWLLSETGKRVESIVRGQVRSGYDGVSLMIAAVAETIRTRDGDEKAWQYILSYKNMYPKHRAFRESLKNKAVEAGFRQMF